MNNEISFNFINVIIYMLSLQIFSFNNNIFSINNFNHHFNFFYKFK